MTLPKKIIEAVDETKLRAVDAATKEAIITEVNNMEEGLARIRRWVALL